MAFISVQLWNGDAALMLFLQEEGFQGSAARGEKHRSQLRSGSNYQCDEFVGLSCILSVVTEGLHHAGPPLTPWTARQLALEQLWVETAKGPWG